MKKQRKLIDFSQSAIREIERHIAGTKISFKEYVEALTEREAERLRKKTLEY